jgi:hypothetical protein
MTLREIIRTVRVPVVDLSRETGVSRFRLYSFTHGDTMLTEAEQKALTDVLLAHCAKVGEVENVLRQVAHA